MSSSRADGSDGRCLFGEVRTADLAEPGTRVVGARELGDSLTAALCEDGLPAIAETA